VPYLNTSRVTIEFSEVIAASSHALDIIEGQAVGHAARTCIIGMRIARELALPEEAAGALFYGLLLKDLGCSSNASKVACLFGSDDRNTKCDLKTTDWTNTFASLGYVMRNVAAGGSALNKASRFLAVAAGGQRAARELVTMRCERGAEIARSLQLPELTAEAILSLDEHWDGGGHPLGLAGEQIPLIARIMGLAQTLEVFWGKGGMDGACEVAARRAGTWFDPELVKIFLSLRNDEALAQSLRSESPAAEAARLEPKSSPMVADESALDRIAEGFARVIDAKSPWTFCHSSGVAEVAVGIAQVLGMKGVRVTKLRRAALLHDIGKLGISNLILDKPGKLTAEELTQMRRHPRFTYQILSRVKAFREFAGMAAAHHERLDGRGYYLGLSGEDLTTEVRILGVADMYEALAAQRPYRKDLSREEVMTVLSREAGVGLCPGVVDALKTYIAQSNFIPCHVAA
jgi:putative nucleotidyltransferase with HDIG domain